MATTRGGKGSAYQDPRTGKFYAQIAMGKGKRKGVLCPLATSLDDARQRSALASELVAMLTEAGQDDYIKGAVTAATTLPLEKLPEARKHAQAIAAGRTPAQKRAELGGLTYGQFAERLTSGKLHKLYPDHVSEIEPDTMKDYTSTLRDYVLPKLGPLPIGAVTLDHALDVMRAVPRELSSSRRRRIAFIMRRVFALAAFPARVIASNPIPDGFLPKLDPPRARGFLFPDEEAQLIAGLDADGETVVPLALRVLFALLSREGLRKDEAASLEYADKRTAGAAGWVDLERGWIYLDRNKTDDARDWALAPDVAEALRRWRKLAPSSRFLFPADDDPKARMNVEHVADLLRAALVGVGVERMELFESSKDRRNIVVHDLRAVFITTALAQGRTEGWIQRRTGHTTSAMLARYRRRAAELEEGERAKLAPMHETIPELAEVGPKTPPPPSTETEGNGSQGVCKASAAPPNAGERSAEGHGNKPSPALARASAPLGSSAERHAGSTPARRTTSLVFVVATRHFRDTRPRGGYHVHVCDRHSVSAASISSSETVTSGAARFRVARSSPTRRPSAANSAVVATR